MLHEIIGEMGVWCLDDKLSNAFIVEPTPEISKQRVIMKSGPKGRGYIVIDLRI